MGLQRLGCGYCRVLWRNGAPYGNRTRVSAVKGRRPGPLDEGRDGAEADQARRRIKGFGRTGKQTPSVWGDGGSVVPERGQHGPLKAC